MTRHHLNPQTIDRAFNVLFYLGGSALLAGVFFYVRAVIR